MKSKGTVALIIIELLLFATAVVGNYIGGYLCPGTLVFDLFLLAAAGLFIAVCVLGIIHSKRMKRVIDTVFNENSALSREIVDSINVPCLFCTSTGHVAWRNKAFNDIYSGKDIKKLFSLETIVGANRVFQVDIAGRTYSVSIMPMNRTSKHAGDLYFLYLTDRTEALHYTSLYENNLPVVALIYVDNYEDLNSERDITKNAVINEVERNVANFAQSVNGMYTRFEGARFMVLFEVEQLAILEEKRFEILNAVRSINTDSDQTVTLSIGVGCSDAILQAHDVAKNAMELALGRGGDQAVVKQGQDCRYYGGKSLSTTRVSRVRVRSVAGAMRELIENSSSIYIMGHRHADLDCVGAAFGVMRCAAALERSASYVIEGGERTVSEMIGAEIPSTVSIITPSEALERFKSSSLLVIVDTQRESLLCTPELYKNASKVLVIDHHRRSADAISNATVTYMEPGASSAAEMVTELIQCFYDKKNAMPFEATVMLAGICLDTKSFVFNTGVRTFDAAGYLKRCGANTGEVKRMFQDDLTTFSARSAVVAKATILPGGIAISFCNQEENSQLIAAQAADSLISIRKVQASFVLTPVGNAIYVSARSLGEINVQRICEMMGGGGHLTVAGAQIKDETMESALAKVRAAVEQYLKEEQEA